MCGCDDKFSSKLRIFDFQVDDPKTPVNVVVKLMLDLFAASDSVAGDNDSDNAQAAAVIPIIRRWSIFRVRWWKSTFLSSFAAPLYDFRTYLAEMATASSASRPGPRDGSSIDAERRIRFLKFLLAKQFLSASSYVHVT